VIEGFSVSGTLGPELRRTIPGGFTASQGQHGPHHRVTLGASEEMGFPYVLNTSISWFRSQPGSFGANWPLMTNTGTIYCPIFEIEVL
jgi:hypothetical protein